MKPGENVQPDDRARLKKTHPCGSRWWRVFRIGADIGIECETCARRVFLSRDEFERRCVERESPHNLHLTPPPASGYPAPPGAERDD